MQVCCEVRRWHNWVNEEHVAAQRNQAQQDVHFRVMRLLQNNPELSQRDLAREVGVSTGGIHYVLNALLEESLIKLGNFTAAPNKRRYAYILTIQGLTAQAFLTRQLLVPKIEEYKSLKVEIKAFQSDLEAPQIEKTI